MLKYAEGFPARAEVHIVRQQVAGRGCELLQLVVRRLEHPQQDPYPDTQSFWPFPRCFTFKTIRIGITTNVSTAAKISRGSAKHNPIHLSQLIPNARPATIQEVPRTAMMQKK